jgi:hypothetical protein
MYSRLRFTFFLLVPLSDALSLPCVGYATRPGLKFIVIGTSHFRCKSAMEVTSLIEQVKPDGVVVELDPERVISLTKEGSTAEPLFGADFLAAIDTSRRMDIPLFVGDEYTKETKARLVSTALSPKTYGPGRLMTSFSPRSSSNSVDLIGTFVSDPLKLAPLAATIALPVFLFFATIQDYRFDDGTADALTFLSIVLSFLATCKVFNILIADRDEILAASAINAASVISSLKKRETIRKRWTFIVDNDTDSETNENDSDKEQATPLFTLKTPLERGKIRTLNLFEPRWLNMIDSLGKPPSKSQFGCVTCTNKFYSAVTINGAEGRYADVIFNRKGTMATLTELTEESRPSGDRKVRASIEGGESFVVNERDLSVASKGYLVASNIVGGGDTYNPVESDGGFNKNEEIKIVVVVGLLHANGVIDRLS